MNLFSADFLVVRFVFERLLALIYLIGFTNIAFQFLPLCGSNGLLPVTSFVRKERFSKYPSLFFFGHSDRVLKASAWVGVGLSAIASSGLSDSFPSSLSFCVWFGLWALYVSFVNVGQVFYAYGWEYLLLELGVLTLLLGSHHTETSLILVWAFRWTLFRLMFGAGLIKIKNDPCWRNLTCMNYHYETQPVPNPLSRWFHYLPKVFHKISAALNHVAELIVPFGIFGPPAIRMVAAVLTIGFQGFLFLSGNFAWINLLTIFLCLWCFDDSAIRTVFEFFHVNPPTFQLEAMSFTFVPTLYYIFGAGIIILSVRPVLNLFHRNQIMNGSFEPLHLINTYGAFGSVLRERFELIIEGTNDDPNSKEARWLSYEFTAKPGDIDRSPRQVSPYAYRLDWELSIAAAEETPQRPWMASLVHNLLHHNPGSLPLIRNPFPGGAPNAIRILRYKYQFADPHSTDTWKRVLRGVYMEPKTLDDAYLDSGAKFHGWGTEALIGANVGAERLVLRCYEAPHKTKLI